jgi:hypothetical protein
VIPPRASEIDEALDDFAGADKKELRAFTEAVSGSVQFRCEAAATVNMLTRGECVSETLWALMIVMLRAGMAIERKRHEVGLLERLYVNEKV